MTQTIEEILEEFETAYVNHGDRFSELKAFLKTKLEQVVAGMPVGLPEDNYFKPMSERETIRRLGWYQHSEVIKAYQAELTK